MQGFDFTAAVQSRGNAMLDQTQLGFATGYILLNFLNHLWFSRLTHGHTGAGRVQYADRFVWQLPTGDVTVRKANGIFDRFVQNFHRMVLFQSGNDATEHVHRRVWGRLLHLDHLKSTSQGRIALHIFFVFCPSGGRNGS